MHFGAVGFCHWLVGDIVSGDGFVYEVGFLVSQVGLKLLTSYTIVFGNSVLFDS